MPSNRCFLLLKGKHMYKRNYLKLFPVKETNEQWDDFFADQLIYINELPLRRIGHVVDAKTLTEFQCTNCGEKRFARMNDIQQGYGCLNCAGKIPYTKETANLKYKKVGLPSAFICIGEVTRCDDLVEHICSDCGKIFKTSINVALKHKTGQCKKCLGLEKVTKEIVNLYFQKNNKHIICIEEVINTKVMSSFQCVNPLCGKIFKAALSHVLYRGDECPHCSPRKKSENATIKYLKEIFSSNRVESNTESHFFEVMSDGTKIFPDARMYVNKQLHYVEYHGEQHYQPVRFGGMPLEEATERFNNYQVPRDTKFREYCKEHNIILHEIDGRKYKGKKIREYILNEIKPKIG